MVNRKWAILMIIATHIPLSKIKVFESTYHGFKFHIEQF